MRRTAFGFSSSSLISILLFITLSLSTNKMYVAIVASLLLALAYGMKDVVLNKQEIDTLILNLGQIKTLEDTHKAIVTKTLRAQRAGVLTLPHYTVSEVSATVTATSSYIGEWGLTPKDLCAEQGCSDHGVEVISGREQFATLNTLTCTVTSQKSILLRITKPPQRERRMCRYYRHEGTTTVSCTGATNLAYFVDGVYIDTEETFEKTFTDNELKKMHWLYFFGVYKQQKMMIPYKLIPTQFCEFEVKAELLTNGLVQVKFNAKGSDDGLVKISITGGVGFHQVITGGQRHILINPTYLNVGENYFAVEYTVSQSNCGTETIRDVIRVDVRRDTTGDKCVQNCRTKLVGTQNRGYEITCDKVEGRSGVAASSVLINGNVLGDGLYSTTSPTGTNKFILRIADISDMNDHYKYKIGRNDAGELMNNDIEMQVTCSEGTTGPDTVPITDIKSFYLRIRKLTMECAVRDAYCGVDDDGTNVICDTNRLEGHISSTTCSMNNEPMKPCKLSKDIGHSNTVTSSLYHVHVIDIFGKPVDRQLSIHGKPNVWCSAQISGAEAWVLCQLPNSIKLKKGSIKVDGSDRDESFFPITFADIHPIKTGVTIEFKDEYERQYSKVIDFKKYQIPEKTEGQTV